MLIVEMGVVVRWAKVAIMEDKKHRAISVGQSNGVPRRLSPRSALLPPWLIHMKTID
jgi:hypothetical protein